MSSQEPLQERAEVFAQAVLAAFRDAGRVSDTDVAKADGPSSSYMTQLRQAANEGRVLPRPRSHIQKAIESVAGWSPGSTLRVWYGQDPIVGGDGQDARRNETDFVEAPGVKVESGITNEDLLREILRSRAEYDQIRAEVRDLSGRMDRLEQSGS